MSAPICTLPEAESALITSAAKAAGFDVYIAQAVRPGLRGPHPIPGKITVFTRTPERDHLLFWETYRKLREAAKRAKDLGAR